MTAPRIALIAYWALAITVWQSPRAAWDTAEPYRTLTQDAAPTVPA